MNNIELLQGSKWLKHPLHPALVALPIGSWLFSFVMDNVATVTGSKCAQEAADAAITVGLAGAVMSAATGITEFLRVPERDNAVETAVTHGTLNLTATALYGVNGLIRTSRRNRGRPTRFFPKFLSLVTVAAVGYTGWLGGNLVYNYGTAVELENIQEKKEEGTPEPSKQEEMPASAHI